MLYVYDVLLYGGGGGVLLYGGGGGVLLYGGGVLLLCIVVNV